jgi:gliding motility-associated-like protein
VNFDDGSTSEDKNPVSHLFPNVRGGKIFNVSLTVENSIGCYDTVTTQIAKLQSCAVGVPNAFTPNNDGLNDFLYPLNTSDVTHLEFRVFNRFGQMIFESRDGTKKWDGRLNGQLQPSGTYIWMLSYNDNSGRKINETGSTLLIR